MTLKIRGDIEVPQRIILGNDKNSFIVYESAGISLYVNNEAQFMVTADGATIGDDVVLNSVTISRTGENPIQIVDISNHVSLGIGLGLLIDNSFGDDDFRLYLPKINTDDQVIFNPGPGNDTAIVKFKKNMADSDGNIFTKYTLGAAIYDDDDNDILLGAIANIVGVVDIVQPINSDTTSIVSDYDTSAALAIVQSLAVKNLIWDQDGRADPEFVGFYGPGVVTAGFTEATFTSTDHGLLISQNRLLPVLWSCVRYLMENDLSYVLTGTEP